MNIDSLMSVMIMSYRVKTYVGSKCKRKIAKTGEEINENVPLHCMKND